jgi:hypothetical protein
VKWKQGGEKLLLLRKSILHRKVSSALLPFIHSGVPCGLVEAFIGVQNTGSVSKIRALFSVSRANSKTVAAKSEAGKRKQS